MTEQHDAAGGCSTMSEQWAHPTTFYTSGFHPDLMPTKRRIVISAEWWFRGAADQAITQCFTHVLEAAAGGELDHWDPRSRLALIIILDQFSRSAYRDTARAYAQDAKALALAIEGMDNGHYGTGRKRSSFFR